MKRLAWKYLAGLIDGEGCIDVVAGKVAGSDMVYIRPRVRIAMRNDALFLLEMCKNSFGGYLCSRTFDNPNWGDATSWELVGYKQTCMFLRNIVNHLFLKKEQARFCLWMEQNLKGQRVSQKVRDAARKELKLMKRDPHRLSEKAEELILQML